MSNTKVKKNALTPKAAHDYIIRALNGTQNKTTRRQLNT